MTRPIPADTGPLDHPAHDTAVLMNCKHNPAARPARKSVFSDDCWDLTPGLFEAHAVPCRLNFLPVPATFRVNTKRYIWQLINHEQPHRLRSTRGTRLALRSVSLALPRLTTLLVWLDAHGITSCDQATPDDLDRYLADVISMEATPSKKATLLVEVRRLWSHRDRLPAQMRLPAVDWQSEEPKDLLGGHVRPRENRTPRLNTDTIDLLLMWSLRFVEDFADDIIAAFHEHLRLFPYGPSTRKHGIQVHRRSIDEVLPDLTAYLTQLKRRGGDLPGRVGEDGEREIDWPHLVRLFRTATTAFHHSRRLRDPVERSGLPIARDAYLDAPITGLLDGQPWRSTRIGFAEAVDLANLLRTACLVLVSYLSGMRTGEALNLERGCLSHNSATGIWTVAGKHFKGAYDDHGNKIPEGQLRKDPWVVVEQTAHAITVLERLHTDNLLFPSQLHPHRGNYGRTRKGLARRAESIPLDTAAFLGWIKDYCAITGRDHEIIPPDPHGAISAARFRRTLAWHIVRKPRGLVAGAIQYGHLHLQITLGYGGTYNSGFPDEHAYEDWLFRLERLAEDHQQLEAGEHVSGPAAPTYVHRITQAHQQFAGRVLTNTSQAHDMLANPLLQIYPGRAMTCVFDPTKALCQLRGDERDRRATPDQDDCRSNCRNIAYTDRDIADFRKRTKDLEALLSEFLAPSPRYRRARAELDRVRTIVRNHDRTR